MDICPGYWLTTVQPDQLSNKMIRSGRKKSPSREFITRLQGRTAQAAIGASTLRNQGASGVVGSARKSLSKLNLWKFGKANRLTFPKLLDDATNNTMNCFPIDAQNWGAARKAANIFLRDACYNYDLCCYFGLARIRRWLEIPLDKDVAKCLHHEQGGSNLPKWTGLKKLTPVASREYQDIASIVARRRRVARVDLDVYYWRAKE